MPATRIQIVLDGARVRPADPEADEFCVARARKAGGASIGAADDGRHEAR